MPAMSHDAFLLVIPLAPSMTTLFSRLVAAVMANTGNQPASACSGVYFAAGDGAMRTNGTV
ncbi:hypothetical protein [Azomonas macrocytogenes]|uniref:Uncharacterized protein n=1 Tax=Azomonas macrocytogenes TaxID=69962 RepID=A0A839T3P5_AZOMA|nr:hypothetical protein [Azomonas macrocytogenes]MBB3102964.1 hypothetical protein [Azomonas macrocytogenes]